MNRLSFAILTNKLFNEWIKNNRSLLMFKFHLKKPNMMNLCLLSMNQKTSMPF